MTVDVGNTSTVLGVWDGDVLRARWRVGTERRRMVSEYAVLLRDLFALEGLPPPDAAVVSSVVPPVEHELEEALRRYYGVEAYLVTADSARLRVETDTPSEVGADRLVNAVGALGYGDPRGRYVVVDFGTATTFDLVEAPDRYLGGAIAPGPQTAADALALKTAKLPRVDLVPPPRGPVGKNTVEALQSGLVLGYAALVDGMVARFKEASGDALVIATGGFAQTLKALCRTVDVVDPDLTLKGLRLIWEQAA